jgi:uncharacterized membrane protein
MRSRPDDLVVVIATSILLILIIEVVPDSPVRSIIGLFFILFLPGYVTIAALYPEKGGIDAVERIALSLGVSIAIFALMGLGEYYAFSGINLETIEFTQAGFVVIFAFIAWQRRMRLPEDERFAIDLETNLSMKGMPLVDRLLVVGIAITTAALIVLSMMISPPTMEQPYSEIGLLGPEGAIGGYPHNLTVDQQSVLNVSVGSHENASRDYSLVILLQSENATGTNITHWRNGNPFNGTQSLEGGLAMAYNFTLQPSEYMNSTFDFSVAQNGTYKLRFMLFYDGADVYGQPSLEAWVWVNIRN